MQKRNKSINGCTSRGWRSKKPKLLFNKSGTRQLKWLKIRKRVLIRSSPRSRSSTATLTAITSQCHLLQAVKSKFMDRVLMGQLRSHPFWLMTHQRATGAITQSRPASRSRSSLPCLLTDQQLMLSLRKTFLTTWRREWLVSKRHSNRWGPKSALKVLAMTSWSNTLAIEQAAPKKVNTANSHPLSSLSDSSE